MENIIRKLTHDNKKFDSQWDEIENQLLEESDQNNISSIIDALGKYVLEEPNTPSPSNCKYELLTRVINSIDYTSDHPLLDKISQVFLRVFDQGRIDQWYLTFLKELYQHFQLETYFSQKPPLIEQLLLILKKHSFTLTSTDESTLEEWEEFFRRDIFNSNLLNEKVLATMKDKFQQLCRFAIQNSSSSSFWSGITAHILDDLSELFDSYVNPTDVRLDLDLYLLVDNSKYKELIRKSLFNQVNLFKTNYNQILLTLEHLLIKNNINEAARFFDEVFIKHFSAISDQESLLQMFIRISLKIPIEQREEFTTRILSDLCDKLNNAKTNKKLWPLYFDLATIALELHTFRGPSCAEDLLIKENFYPWKELGERLSKIIQLCGNYDDFIVEEKSYFNKLDSLKDILGTIYDRAKVYNNIFHGTHTQALTYTLRWLSPPPSQSNENNHQWPIHVYKMGNIMINLIDRKQITFNIYSQLLQKIHGRLQIEEDTDETDGTEESFLIHLVETLGIYIKTLQTFPSSIHTLLNSISLVILDRPLLNENGTSTTGQRIFNELWSKFPETVTTEEDARIYEPSVAKLYTFLRNESGDETDLFPCWRTFWNTIGLRFPLVANNQIETILNEFIDRNQIDFMNLLQNLYPQRPEPFHARIDSLIEASFEQSKNKNQYGMIYLFLLQTIGKHHPEIISSAHIDRIFTYLSRPKLQLNDGELHSLFQFLALVASIQPNLFDKHQQDILRIATKTKNTSVFFCLQKYFVSSTIVNGEKVVNDYLSKLISLLKHKDGCTQDNRQLILHACELIGIRHKKLLETKRQDFVTLNCSQLVQFIDDVKMTEENKQVFEQSRQEIDNMEKRVRNTEKDVQQVKSTVKRQELDVTNLRAHVNTIDTQIQVVTDQVDIHQKEIERIDAKTLSYVPAWAGDICKLLNRRSTNDWRLLGRRFGYSSSELQHWATQSDPCMALLNEWYMTHKADEATFGLIKMLKEIGREDVEKIIRKAVKDAGETIPDNIADIDVHRLPPVFISYQWNTQAVSSQLKGRLEEAGYACWMDMGQMGGGQELYSKVDKGIRGAKVIICCMNKEYAKSDTCIGQVNLAISTGKPLIPLQMEKQTWPPEGALGPLMSEYLFIRFFDRKATNDPNFWPDERFTELLGQIRYYVAPDPAMISERYKDWFVPRVENLIFLKPTDSNNGSTKHDNNTQLSLVDIPLVISHPQIMISYQWDRQSDILELYKQLTELGYRVWLDIFQMGGGDSLFAKIDAGIRNAQCVIACVTPKYTLSTNCRREMSLADALQKPIIPLLLEQLNENWPPTGPMSLVFTDKLYVDFRSHQKNDMWQGKEYDQILVKLTQLVPEVNTEHLNKHLNGMGRPSSSTLLKQTTTTTSPLTPPMKRIGSAPVISQSRTCSIL